MSGDPSPSTSAPTTVTKRIHISPLDPSTHTREALLSLLSPHASSVSLSSWPPKLNAVGQPRNYVHATMQGDEAKIKKAMARISGSVWKGTKLFLREAKKDYKGGYGSADEAAGADKKNAEDDGSSKKRKRKAAKPPRREHETINSIITEADVKEGKVWGWKVTPAGHLLRPIQMRPEKPLPTPAAASSSSSKSSTSMRKIKQAAKKAQAAPPPSRARRQLIDPTRYGATHLGEALLGDEGVEAGHEVWVCEELEDGEGEEGKVRWVRQGSDGVEAEEFAVRPQRQAVTAEVGQEDVDVQGDEAPSQRSTSPSPSPSSSSSSPSPSDSPRSPSPIPSAAASPQLGPGNFSLTAYDPEEDDRWSDGYDEARGATAAGGADAAAGAADETARGMNLLKEMFGSGWKPAAVKGAAVVQQADAEDDDDEEEEEEEADGAWWKKPARPTKAAKVEKKQTQPAAVSAKKPSRKEQVEEPKAPAPPAKASKMKAQAPPPPAVEEKVVDEPPAPAAKAERKQKKQVQKPQEKSVAPVVEPAAPPAAAPSPPPAAPTPTPASAAPTPTTSAPPAIHDASASSPSGPPAAASRRAALMAKMRQAAVASSSVGSHPTPSFAPVARFEPGVATAAAGPADVQQEQPVEAAQAAPSKSEAPAAASSQQNDGAAAGPAAEATTVRMGSFKDMFKPQEGAGGFSLMGSLLGDEELELDDGMEFDAAADGDWDEAEDDGGKEEKEEARPSTMHASRQAALSSITPTASSSNFFFPPPSHTLTTGEDDDDSIMLSFLRPDSEEQVRDKWEQRKTDLTQDYKRRHREAVKKSRRKGVGAVTGGRRGR